MNSRIVKIDVDLYEELPSELTRKVLEADLHMLNRNPTEEDLATFEALQTVLAWYSSKSQLLEFEAGFNINPEWAHIAIAQQKAEKEQKLKQGLAMVQAMFPGIKGVGFVV